MQSHLDSIIDFSNAPIGSDAFRAACRRTLERDGALVLRDFVKPAAVESIRDEGHAQQHLAYYTADDHTVYLTPRDDALPDEHPRNRLVASSKGCITDDQIPAESALRTLYDANEFREFLSSVLGESALYSYADPLSSINLHYAKEGQELGWHYDNSSFAVTLLVQAPEAGGEFEYVRDVRDADSGDMNYAQTGQVLDGDVPVKTLAMQPGTLVLFRGRNSMHRVTPTIGNRTRMLAVLAYNTEPGVSLSESARTTFYGRLS